MEKIRLKSQEGQSLVEFAMSMTFMLFLIVGIVDFGRAFYSFMALRDAVQEGALYGSLHPTNFAGIEGRVKGVATGPLDMSQVTVNSYWKGSPCAGHEIVVEATYPFQIAMPFLGAILGTQSFPLNASIEDYILVPPCPSSGP